MICALYDLHLHTRNVHFRIFLNLRKNWDLLEKIESEGSEKFAQPFLLGARKKSTHISNYIHIIDLF